MSLELKQVTIKLYNTLLNILNNNNVLITPKTNINSLVSSLNNIKMLNGQQYKTRLNFLKAIQWYLRNNNSNDSNTLINDISKLMRKLSNECDTEISKNKLSDTQKKNFLEWPDVIKIFRKVKNNKDISQENYKDYLLLSLYCLFDVRRVKDYSEMFVGELTKAMDNTKNYYYVNGSAGYFVFNNYKTFAYYGQQQFKVPTKLKNVINQYINKFNINNKLLNFSEEELQYRLLTVFKRYVDKNIGVNILRHSFISYVNNNNNLTLEQRKYISDRMAHSIKAQLQYVKYDQIDKPKIKNNKKNFIKKDNRVKYNNLEDKKNAVLLAKKKWRDAHKDKISQYNHDKYLKDQNN